MKTSEFKREAEKLGFYVIVQNDAVYVRINGFQKHWIMRISNNYCGDVKADFNGVAWIYDFKALYELAVELSFTPFYEREDEPHFFVRLFPLRYSINSCLSDDEGISTTNANIFTPSTYAEFIRTHSEWKPFLKDYDPDNKTVFVPVEVSK